MSIRFTEKQRQSLRELKWEDRQKGQEPRICQLLPEQINRLDQILPSCEALLRKPVKMMDIRANLTAVMAGLREAQQLVAAQSPAGAEIRTRLQIAASNAAADDPFDALDVVALLGPLAEIAESALQALPKEERRADASPLPIERIERALLRGFADHYGSGARPKYSIWPSVTRRPFPDIAAIVYEAIYGKGEKTAPERAIRRYIALRRQLKQQKCKRLKQQECDADGLPLREENAGASLLPAQADGPFSPVADGNFCPVPRAGR